MFKRVSKLFPLLPISPLREMSARINGVGAPVKIGKKTFYGPFTIEQDKEGLALLLKDSQIVPQKGDKGYVEAYSPLLAERFNSEVVNTIGVLSGRATEYSDKSHVIFYTETPPVVVNDQYIGDVVGFNANNSGNTLAVEIAITATRGEVTSHNELLVTDLKSRINASIDTLPESRREIYRSSFYDYCSKFVESVQTNRFTF